MAMVCGRHGGESTAARKGGQFCLLAPRKTSLTSFIAMVNLSCYTRDTPVRVRYSMRLACCPAGVEIWSGKNLQHGPFARLLRFSVTGDDTLAFGGEHAHAR